jgi:hypothetical protein
LSSRRAGEVVADGGAVMVGAVDIEGQVGVGEAAVVMASSKAPRSESENLIVVLRYR